MNRRILIIAGEASGDRHAADLVAALRERDPELQFSGIGGEAMRRAGVSLHYHLSDLAVLGITEVIRHLPFIRNVLRHLKTLLRERIDAVILVDYPGFNLRVARMAKKLGVPVIYYISPQLWAWGEGRVRKIRRDIDLLLVLFRFEVDFYKRHGIDATFVGHPLVDQLAPASDEAAFRADHGLEQDRPILALLPGSREMEVRNLLPVMAKAARELVSRHPVIPVLGMADSLPDSLYDALLPGDLPVGRLRGETHRLMRHAHTAMVASGTATLELGYLETPMAVLYTVAPLTYRLGRMLVKIDNIALVNIVLGRTVVPELIQHDVTVEGVAAAVEVFLSDPERHRAVREALGGVRTALGEPGASARAADAVLTFLKQGASAS